MKNCLQCSDKKFHISYLARDSVDFTQCIECLYFIVAHFTPMAAGEAHSLCKLLEKHKNISLNIFSAVALAGSLYKCHWQGLEMFWHQSWHQVTVWYPVSWSQCCARCHAQMVQCISWKMQARALTLVTWSQPAQVLDHWSHWPLQWGSSCSCVPCLNIILFLNYCYCFTLR